MQAALSERIAEVRTPGQYLGFLEWVAWAVARKRRVYMRYGGQVWDIVSLFAPALQPIAYEGECRVAAARVQTFGEPLAAGPDVVPNHFLIGVASGSVRDEASRVHPCTSARGAALRAGWLLKGTVAQGDCGVDVMAYHLGLERT